MVWNNWASRASSRRDSRPFQKAEIGGQIAVLNNRRLHCLKTAGEPSMSACVSSRGCRTTYAHSASTRTLARPATMRAHLLRYLEQVPRQKTCRIC